MDGLLILIIAVAIAISIAVISHRNKMQRRKFLIEKYGLEAAEKIIAKRIWEGMTTEQLIESWGRPDDVDTKVFKQKTSETWKYGQTGKNRFSDRVFTENGVVVGWQQH
jgi:hypothetical protein